jgi:hypothetical protein
MINDVSLMQLQSYWISFHYLNLQPSRTKQSIDMATNHQNNTQSSAASSNNDILEEVTVPTFRPSKETKTMELNAATLAQSSNLEATDGFMYYSIYVKARVGHPKTRTETKYPTASKLNVRVASAPKLNLFYFISRKW